MRECLRLAQKGRGYVSPNPLVGAVLVVDGRIVAKGYHRRYGAEHAEVDCLKNFRGDLSSATFYVNLEPCSFYGKTPPCTDLILQRGIRHVVVGMRDPNPRVGGRGLKKLRQAGVRVDEGVLQEESQHLNRFFVKHIGKGIPYVHVKIAQTRSGHIAETGAPGVRYLTSPASLRRVHRLRAEYDAVLVGAGTVRKDNPRLTVRRAAGRDPAVVVLDGRLRVSGNERVFASAHARPVVLCTTRTSVERSRAKVRRLEGNGVRMLVFASRNGRVSLRTALRRLYGHNIGSLLVEGGAGVFTEFVQQGIVDEMSFFISSRKISRGVALFRDDGACSRKIIRMINRNHFTRRSSGGDILLHGIVQRW